MLDYYVFQLRGKANFKPFWTLKKEAHFHIRLLESVVLYSPTCL